MNLLKYLFFPKFFFSMAEGDPPPGDPPPAPAADAWMNELDPSIKEHPSLSVYKGKPVSEVLKAYVSQQKFLGGEKVPAPKADWSPEQWQEWADQTGMRPKTPDDYQFSKDVKLAEGLSLSDEGLKAFREKAHALGMRPDQVNGMYEFYVNTLNSQSEQFQTAQTESRQQAETALRQKHGKAYDQFIAGAKQVAAQVGGKEFMQYLEESGAGNDPRVINMLGSLAKVMSEDELKGKVSQITLSPDEAQAKIREIQGDPKHPYNVGGHPDHKKAVEFVNSLFEQAHPDDK